MNQKGLPNGPRIGIETIPMVLQGDSKAVVTRPMAMVRLPRTMPPRVIQVTVRFSISEPSSDRDDVNFDGGQFPIPT